MENKNIKIIDRTLIELWEKDSDRFIKNIEKIKKLSSLLYDIGADIIEINEDIYNLLNLKDNKKKVNNSNSFFRISNNISVVEITDDIFLKDYNKFFLKINKNIEISFKNINGFATALTYEWINAGGINVVTSFTGIGNFAPLEEILGIIQFIDNVKPLGNLTLFPKILNIFEEIACEKLPQNKPCIGNSIFNVESGVHVDGIYKNPICFEPYEPSKVGRERSIVLGKFSGKRSIKIKLTELNINCDDNKIIDILKEVKKVSNEKMRGLLDNELFEICKKVGV